MLKSAAFLTAIILSSATAVHGAANQACKARIEDASTLRFHGRLSVYNGGYPNLRLWQVGTHHLFGIFGDPADMRCTRSGNCKGDEDTKLPTSLEHLDLLGFSTYGDFEVRVLEPFRQGHMQAACIVDVRNIVRRRPD